MTQLVLLVGNHTVIELQGLTNSVTAAPQNDATVTVTLKNRQGANISGQTWPASMAYVAASAGLYRATLDADLVVTSGTHYVAFIEVSTPGGLIAHWEADVIAQTRRS